MHSSYGGLGDLILNSIYRVPKLREKAFEKFAIKSYPACGTPQEVLIFHKLDGRSLANRIIKSNKGN